MRFPNFSGSRLWTLPARGIKLWQFYFLKRAESTKVLSSSRRRVSVDDWCFRPDFLRAFEDEPAENISVIATHFVEVLSFVVFRATEAIQGGLNVNLYDAHFKIVIFKRSQHCLAVVQDEQGRYLKLRALLDDEDLPPL
ncbi:uncharacterized protein EHS24_004711 [Apiotrichum porosum]|uniref:Uncharacterized protein n=1 Tax=Apiotrichum porosum TaxID=105984 RepID=A0A427Y5T7_9TREE|nr:uncharacterized protein EHS24_004711 [Apiotrichum porosum]RSH86455.1 hypothetical protein EHS24_004711 [Apiotrichum porosum]